MSVTVNISARQLQSGSTITEAVREALISNALPANALQLALTEAVLQQENPTLATAMEELEKMGISILIDDFGTGNASLLYLQRYHVDAVKIDRGYIRKVLEDNQDAKLVRAIVAMAYSLDVAVVAEGVETIGQLK